MNSVEMGMYITTRNAPRIIVARPRAVPIPLPLMAFGPTRLNLCTSIFHHRISHEGVHYRQERKLRSRPSTYETRKGRRDFVHGRILQHVRNDEEPNHASSDINLVKLRYTSITASNGNILQRDVQVILRYPPKKYA